MYLFTIDWEYVIKDMAAITPIGKMGAYFFGRYIQKSIPNDTFVRFVIPDGTTVITEIRIIPVYL